MTVKVNSAVAIKPLPAPITDGLEFKRTTQGKQELITGPFT